MARNLPYADDVDASYYYAMNPDVASAHFQAARHYHRFGWHEGRNPDSYFDTLGYLTTYQDVAAAGIDPLRHFHRFGWHEGREPSPAFDAQAYLAANPDVAAAGIDPLAHYLRFGRAEGRQVIAKPLYDADGSANAVNEHASAGTATGVTFSWGGFISPNLKYTLVGDTSGGGFKVDASTGAVTIADPSKVDYNGSGPSHSYTVTVQASDLGHTITQSAVIAVGGTNTHAPTFTSTATPSVQENAVQVVTLTTSDPDTTGNNPPTYTIIGGADALKFQIVHNDQLQFINAPDYETPGSTAHTNTYEVQVSANDGANVSIQPLTVTVTNVNEPPVFSSGTTASEPENTDSSNVVYKAQAADPEGAAVVYTLSGDDAGIFNIDQASGAITFKQSPDYEMPADANHDNVYKITVTATAGGNTSDATNQDVTITVQDVSYVRPNPDVNSAVADPNLAVAGNVLANDIVEDSSDKLSVANPGSYEGIYGTTTINADGSYTYSPKTLSDPDVANAFNKPGPHQDQIQYTAIDQAGNEGKSTLTVTVNVGLRAQDDTATATEAGSGSNGTPGIDPTGNVLDNDTGHGTNYKVTVTEVDGESAGAPLAGNYGSITLKSDGSYIYHVDNSNPTVDALAPGQSLTDTFNYTITNADGQTANATLTVTIQGADDAPVVTAGHTLTYTAHQGAATIDPALAVSDVDGAYVTAATVQITGNYIKGEDVLDGPLRSATADSDGYYQLLTPGYTNIYEKFDSSTGTLTFRGTDSDAHYQNVLASVTYTNTSDNPSTAPRTVTFTATDEHNLRSQGATDTINVTPVNQPPVAEPDNYGFAQNATPGGVKATLPTAGEHHLTQTELDAAVSAAIDQWAAAGVDAGQIATLKATSYQVADLAGGTVGLTSPGHVLIDTDAAGHGWFVDPTPNDHFDFTHVANAIGTDFFAEPSSTAAGHIDLVTVVAHEMGHVLGLPDITSPADGHDLMSQDLVDGEQRLPNAGDVEQTTLAPTNTAQASDAHGDAVQGAVPAGNHFVVGSASLPSGAQLPQHSIEIAGYSAAHGDLIDVSAIIAALHPTSGVTPFQAIENDAGTAASLQLNTGKLAEPQWAEIAQIDNLHVGDDVALDTGVSHASIHIHVEAHGAA